MPNDDFGEKTEAPTPRRIEEARERGQVARSTDLTAAFMLLAATAVLYFGGSFMGGTLMDALHDMLGQSSPMSITDSQANKTMVDVMLRFGMAMAPMLIGMSVVALLATLIQGGFVFSTHPLVPSLDKLNPITGFGRVFSKRSLARLCGSMLKLGALAVVAYLAILSDFERMALLSLMAAEDIVVGGSNILLILCFKMAAVLIVLAVFDYIYQRWQFSQDMRMSKQEIREEMKRMEGDPMIREHRRQMQRQMIMHRMSREVPKADAVITNPTHVAIAIRYDQDSMAAPRVIAKGADFLAQRIREIAMENGVPIVEKPALARAIYKSVEVGQEVPAEFYKSIAEVLAFVYRLNNRSFNPSAA